MASVKRTYEKKAAQRNNVMRVLFVGVSLIMELGTINLLLVTAGLFWDWLSIAARAAAVVLSLVIYSQYKTSSMKVPWIFLILLFPLPGVVLYLLVGMDGSTRKMRKRYTVIDEALFPLLPENRKEEQDLMEKCPDAGTISAYIHKFGSYPVYRNTALRYYPDAYSGIHAQLEDMKKAEKFIFMEYHAIENRTSWAMIEEVLAERAAAGVEVRVCYDDIGSSTFVNKDFAKHLEQRGIQCRVFNALGVVFNVFLNNRDHRKITVVDGKVGYTGGYNLADEYFNFTHPYGMWKDTGIRLEGEAVRSLTVTFLEMWNAAKPTDTSFDKFMTDYSVDAGEDSFVQPYADTPIDHENVGEETYISMINKANRYVYFITPYLIITDEMNHALNLAAKRGVDVRIVTPGIPDKKIVYGVTRSFYNRLTRNGVRVFEWTPGFCHCKMCVSDDRMATVGTINMDYRSLYHHFENGCFIYNSRIVREIRTDFEELFSESREVTEQYTTGRSAGLRAGQVVLRLFAELL